LRREDERRAGRRARAGVARVLPPCYCATPRALTRSDQTASNTSRKNEKARGAFQSRLVIPKPSSPNSLTALACEIALRWFRRDCDLVLRVAAVIARGMVYSIGTHYLGFQPAIYSRAGQHQRRMCWRHGLIRTALCSGSPSPFVRERALLASKTMPERGVLAPLRGPIRRPTGSTMQARTLRIQRYPALNARPTTNRQHAYTSSYYR